MDDLKARGLVLLGCGKMGSAMLEGWLGAGAAARSVWVIDPNPSAWLTGLDRRAPQRRRCPRAPPIVLVAVKPQMMGDALPTLAALGNGATLFLSVAAGTPIAAFEAVLGAQHADRARDAQHPGRDRPRDHRDHRQCPRHARRSSISPRTLLGAVGQVVRLDDEAADGCGHRRFRLRPGLRLPPDRDAGGGGRGRGACPPTSRWTLARATVAGAGALAEAADDSPAQLRVNVTSPGGTTQAALEVLMDETDGFPALLAPRGQGRGRPQPGAGQMSDDAPPRSASTTS